MQICTVFSEIITNANSKVASTMSAQYFNKRRGLANGIVYAGGGIGGTAISFAMDGLIQKLGPEWTFRIIGLVTLATSLPAAWLIKERAPITTTTLIEWYVSPTGL
jgi:MFS family permease